VNQDEKIKLEALLYEYGQLAIKIHSGHSPCSKYWDDQEEVRQQIYNHIASIGDDDELE
jgi:hypothetical protein